MTYLDAVNRLVPQEAVEKLVSHINGLCLSFDVIPAEHSYTSAALILVDAVLSANRRYKEFVVPRIDKLKHDGIDQRSLTELLAMTENSEAASFALVWNYNDIDRVYRLRELIKRFLDFKHDYGIQSDFKTLTTWGSASTLDHFGSFNVKGIGLATFQYLRILCGSDTVKPDIHIRQAVSDGLNERVTNDKRVIALVEAAAFSLQISARILEYSIWLHYSEGAKTRLRRCPQV